MTTRSVFLSFALLCTIAAGAQAAPTVAPDFVTLVKQEGTTVVNISTTRTIRDSDLEAEGPELSPEDPFNEFFRRFGTPGPREYLERSLGSGFIISEDGYILTNAHVVAKMDQPTVKLQDKREFKAKVIGIDPRTDVALIKIEAKGLRKVTIGDPAKLEVGEWVAAIGSPFGFENSVTAGIVSAKGRLLPDESYVAFIQTDVAINPGSSGSPLFNSRGEVVGVNSMIYSGSGGYMGLSFAVPINLSMRIANQLQEHGAVLRAYLGAEFQEMTPALAQSFGLPASTTAGALVVRVEAGSPAEAAGLAQGDAVLALDGKPLLHFIDLPQQIAQRAPGSRLQLEVWRRGAARMLQVALVVQPAVAGTSFAAAAPEWNDGLGLSVGELSPAQRLQLRIDSGLMVREAGGLARSEGIRAGDVVVAMNTTKLYRPEDFKRSLARVPPGDTVALLVMRDRRLAYVAIRLPASRRGRL